MPVTPAKLDFDAVVEVFKRCKCVTCRVVSLVWSHTMVCNAFRNRVLIMGMNGVLTQKRKKGMSFKRCVGQSAR